MYNANVSCAILLSFVRAACVKDLEDYCKQKQIQLGIELEALRKLLSSFRSGAGSASSTRSSNSSNNNNSSGSTSSRPASGASRPTTPGTTRSTTSNKSGMGSSRTVVAATDNESDELAAAQARKDAYEKQLEVINAAARLAKGAVAEGCNRGFRNIGANGAADCMQRSLLGSFGLI